MGEFEKRASNNTVSPERLTNHMPQSFRAGVAPGKSSRGWPAIHQHCRLPIANLRLANAESNWQSEIENWQ
jgi:hypothetical protein